jgi:lipoic acid synthetase
MDADVQKTTYNRSNNKENYVIKHNLDIKIRRLYSTRRIKSKFAVKEKKWKRRSVTLPSFLIKNIPKKKNIDKIRRKIGNLPIHTVCESAKCPNIGECFSQNTLTFMILGNICTRSCRFCGIPKGAPSSPRADEPGSIAKVVAKLALDYVVITSVTRDDLADGGAVQFAAVINELKKHNPSIKIEVLIPDFQGNRGALKRVIEARPFVLNHNVETVPRLYPLIRPQADYKRSLNLIKQAKKEDIYTKSGFMVGLGESKVEVLSAIKDLKAAGCDIVTIGQYLPPSKSHFSVVRYVHPDEFSEYREFGKKLGLKIAAGPFVRSSYQAKEIINV